MKGYFFLYNSMTLFVSMPGRKYAISDVYAMVLTFILVYSVTSISKKAIQKRRKAKEFKLQNPRGGGTDIDIQFTNENELASVILTCIADNEQYLVKSPKLKELIFKLVRVNIQQESLVMTPNMLRFLALKFINEDQSRIVKIRNLVLSSNNRVRLLTRILGSGLIGFVGAVISSLPYAILLMVIYYTETENCGYDYNAYFESLPKEAPVTIYAEESAGHLAITDNPEARQVEIYIPDKVIDKVSSINEKQKICTKSYKPSRKKAKVMKFAEFKEKDPVLSQFKDLPEPDVPKNLVR